MVILYRKYRETEKVENVEKTLEKMLEKQRYIETQAEIKVKMSEISDILRHNA